MLSSRPSVLVIGATGNIGDYITSSLIESKDAFSKITVFTSEATVSNKSELLNKWKEAGVHIFAGDVTNPADITKAYSGIEVVISCVGRAVLHQQKELIRLAEESESVQWFFPSEYGTDIEHNDKSPTERPHQVKLAVRKYIREHTKRLRVTYVVVGPYFEMWLSGGSSMDQFGGFDLENNKAVLIGDGAERIGFTTMSDTGKAVVAALRNPETSKDKALKIASFVTTSNEVVAELEKQLGKKIDVSFKSVADLERSEADLWKDGNPLATIATLRRIWATGGTLYDKWDNESIGLNGKNMDSLADGVRKVLQSKGL